MIQHKQILAFLLLCAGIGTNVTNGGNPPQVRPPSTLEHKAVYSGESNSFSIFATGDEPLSFQWRLDGRNLAAQTNRTITITNAQPSDEGDYTALVSNPFGEAASRPAHLFVVPAGELPLHNFTNELGKRLPYFYFAPQDYNPTLRYALLVEMSGSGVNADNYREVWGSGSFVGAASEAVTSFRERVRHPTIILVPIRRSGEQFWDLADMPLVMGIINHLITQFSIDTNQIHLSGYSDGGGAAVALLEKSPDVFASAFLVSGTGATNKPSLFKHIPLWIFHAQDDPNVDVSSSRNFVSALRRVGGSPIYSEFASGGHVGPIGVTIVTPLLLDWLLDQRLGQEPKDPLLSINSPTHNDFYTTGAASLSLAGSAQALAEVITGVNWENTTSKAKGLASGTTNWNTTEISLLADKTNTLIVIATTEASLAPAYGGSTTLSDTFFVSSIPLRASLTRKADGAILNWTGGIAPFLVQRTSELPAVNWIDISPDAIPPLTFTLDDPVSFYRVIGH